MEKDHALELSGALGAAIRALWYAEDLAGWAEADWETRNALREATKRVADLRADLIKRIKEME